MISNINIVRAAVLLICFNVSLFGFANAGVIEYTSIESYFDRDHPLLSSDMKTVESYQEQAHGLLHSFLPSLELVGGVENFQNHVLGSEDSAYYGLRTNLNLYNGGLDQIDSQLSQLSAEISQLEYDEKRQALILQAKELYWQALSAQETRKHLKNQIKTLKSVKTKLEPKMRGGLVLSSDVKELDLELERYLMKASHLEQSFNHLKGKLSYLLGPRFSPSKRIVLKGNIWSGEQAIKTTGRASPRKDRLKKQSEYASKVEQRLNQTIMPRLDLYGKVSQEPFSSREFINNEDRRQTIMGLQVTIPLSNFYTESHKKWAQKSRLQALKEAEKAYHYQVNYSSKARSMRVIATRNRVKQLQALDRQLTSLFSKRVDEFMRGVKSTSDLLGLLDRINDIKTMAVNHQRTLLLTKECMGIHSGRSCDI